PARIPDVRAAATIRRSDPQHRGLLRGGGWPVHRRYPGRGLALSPAPHWSDGLTAPLLVSWQITRDCDLCCLHCCTESAPGKRLPGELAVDEALALATHIVGNDVP